MAHPATDPYLPSAVVWAGYLPAGLHEILIYDPLNKIIYQKQIVLEMCPQDKDSGVPIKIQFPFKEKPLSQELL